MRGSVEDRFWAKVQITDGCWLWLGCRVKPWGYGQIRDEAKRRIGAHRLAWMLANGPIPDDLFVLHSCDNPPCVRRDHLFLGTALDNTADMIAKGRTWWLGRTHCTHGHLLTPENVYRRGAHGRLCRACCSEYMHGYIERKRQQLAA